MEGKHSSESGFRTCGKMPRIQQNKSVINSTNLQFFYSIVRNKCRSYNLSNLTDSKFSLIHLQKQNAFFFI